ncbi:MAG TPA: hypothetical protein DCP90_08110 [Clostridiales bacterium]|nr:MAG: hypothetical protein A2Y22_00120 [Clostridiales bacterium GWD2_32_59]HAN10555.1 hypothetical protein [Clostridiales bacterium]
MAPISYMDIQVGLPGVTPKYINGYENKLCLFEIDKQESCYYLRKGVDEIFETKEIKNKKLGILYPNGKNRCFWEAIADEKIYEKLRNASIQASLSNLMKQQYGDIAIQETNKGYLYKAAMAIYYGLCLDPRLDVRAVTANFDGHKMVTRWEFATLVYKAMHMPEDIYKDGYSKNKLMERWLKIGGENMWYMPYVYAIDEYAIVNVEDIKTTKETFAEPIERVEADSILNALTLVQIEIYNGKRISKYLTKYQAIEMIWDFAVREHYFTIKV